MKTSILFKQHCKPFLEITNEMKSISQNGMTLAEVLVSVLLASIFLSIYALAVEIIGTFTPSVSNNINGSEGLIEDHHKLQLTMDLYANSLSQPGISRDKVLTITQSKFGSLPSGCSLNPSVEWDIPVKKKPFENQSWKPSTIGYALCLSPSGVNESTITDLLFGTGKPGIYILMAIPDKISTRSLPTRRLFCRPSPFC